MVDLGTCVRCVRTGVESCWVFVVSSSLARSSNGWSLYWTSRLHGTGVVTEMKDDARESSEFSNGCFQSQFFQTGLRLWPKIDSALHKIMKETVEPKIQDPQLQLSTASGDSGPDSATESRTNFLLPWRVWPSKSSRWGKQHPAWDRSQFGMRPVWKTISIIEDWSLGLWYRLLITLLMIIINSLRPRPGKVVFPCFSSWKASMWTLS